jgi:hypothetical protein
MAMGLLCVSSGELRNVLAESIAAACTKTCWSLSPTGILVAHLELYVGYPDALPQPAAPPTRLLRASAPPGRPGPDHKPVRATSPA